MLKSDAFTPDLPCQGALPLSRGGFAPAQHLHHMDALLQSNDVSLSLSPSLLSLTRDDLKKRKKKKNPNSRVCNQVIRET